jgi:hypothetical protein
MYRRMLKAEADIRELKGDPWWAKQKRTARVLAKLGPLPAGEEAFTVPAIGGGRWLALRSEEPATKLVFPDIRGYVDD